MDRLRHLFNWSIGGLLCVGLFMAGCSERSSATPTPLMGPTAEITAAMTPTVEPQKQPAPDMAEQVDTVVDMDLLAAPNVLATCDHPLEAKVTCVENAEGWQMDIEITAASFARWRLIWDAVPMPLTGDETLALEVRGLGTLAPNLYVVERDGTRFYVNLAAYGLQNADEQLAPRHAAQTLHIPLREFQNEEGVRPRYAEITEIQIVFEWSDMAGTLALDQLRFDTVWQEQVAVSELSHALAAGLRVPDEFAVDILADGLREMTQIQFAPDGTMLVALQGGRVWWYSGTTLPATQVSADIVYRTRTLYESGFPEIVGLLFDPVDHAVWIGGRGQLMRTRDVDGNGAADQREVRVDELPWGRHQNNGLTWNPIPDPFTGEASFHWIYFGLGSVDDLEVGGDKNATIVRFPRLGQSAAELEVVSRGNRNAYDLVWAPIPVQVQSEEQTGSEDLSAPLSTAQGVHWALFASENGPDFNDAPDEVNHIRWQHHYGFPDHFGVVADGIDGEPYSGPVVPVAAHASADGLAFVTKSSWPAAYRTLYVSLFGEVFSPDPVGHIVERIMLTPALTSGGEVTFRGETTEFVGGLDRPLPLTTGPTGDLIVGDYATGVIYRIYYRGDMAGE